MKYSINITNCFGSEMEMHLTSLDWVIKARKELDKKPDDNFVKETVKYFDLLAIYTTCKKSIHSYTAIEEDLKYIKEYCKQYDLKLTIKEYKEIKTVISTIGNFRGDGLD